MVNVSTQAEPVQRYHGLLNVHNSKRDTNDSSGHLNPCRFPETARRTKGGGTTRNVASLQHTSHGGEAD